MDITNEIVRENNLTTMMITHNIRAALQTGSRTVMLDAGRVILDISAEERKRITVDSLLKMYSDKKKEELDNDRMLFG